MRSDNNQQHHQANPPPPQPQSQAYQQEQAVCSRLGGTHEEETAGDAYFGVVRNLTEAIFDESFADFKKRTGIKGPVLICMPSEAICEIENQLAHATDAAQVHEMIRDTCNSWRTRKHVGTAPDRVSGTSDRPLPVQPRGQAGHGALPGAWATAQSSLAGDSLLGDNYRVQKPALARRQGQQLHRMNTRDKSPVRAALRKEEVGTDDPLDGFGFIVFREPRNVGKRRWIQSGMNGQRSELDKHGTQVSHPDVAGDSYIGGWKFWW